jgi:uncharacterized protein YecE (DUF72 family)
MIRVGCCGFGKTRTKYLRKFDLVEIQQTFYQPPQVKTAARWRHEARAGFEFTMLAWQLITHPPASASYEKVKEPLRSKRIKNYGSFQLTSEVLGAWERTAEIGEALGCAMIVFLSPPEFVAEKTNIDNLTKFFGSIERGGLQMAWEPTSRWPEDLVISLCRDLDLIYCSDPFIQRPLNPPPWYLRLHGKGDQESLYTDKDLRGLRRLLSNCPEAYVLFCNQTMVEDATRLKKMLK